MNQRNPVYINKWLIPFSWLYGFVVYMRNCFFRWGIYKQKEYNIPIICVGNISVGGTGKTPHTEYLIRLLKDKYKVAVLSRGYKRKTKGYILSTANSTAKEIGDEPYQIKQKFPHIIVAVDRDRCKGVEKLLALETPPDVVILDDGFQHRHLKPSYKVILSDFSRPVYEDRILPAGRLREPAHYLRFASDIIITKCPETLLPLEYRLIAHDIDPYPFQGLFYTTFGYKNIEAVYRNKVNKTLSFSSLKHKHVLLVTGIASPKLLKSKLGEYAADVTLMQYADHHDFGSKDLKNIEARFEGITNLEKIIIVTEKDAGRFKNLKEVSEQLKDNMYFIPIEVSFLEEKQQEEFDKRILNHVEKYTRNS